MAAPRLNLVHDVEIHCSALHGIVWREQSADPEDGPQARSPSGIRCRAASFTRREGSVGALHAEKQPCPPLPKSADWSRPLCPDNHAQGTISALSPDRELRSQGSLRHGGMRAALFDHEIHYLVGTPLARTFARSRSRTPCPHRMQSGFSLAGGDELDLEERDFRSLLVNHCRSAGWGAFPGPMHVGVRQAGDISERRASQDLVSLALLCGRFRVYAERVRFSHFGYRGRQPDQHEIFSLPARKRVSRKSEVAASTHGRCETGERVFRLANTLRNRRKTM